MSLTEEPDIKVRAFAQKERIPAEPVYTLLNER